MKAQRPNFNWRLGNAWYGLAHRATLTVSGGETKVGLYPAWGIIVSGLMFLGALAYLAASIGIWQYYVRQHRYETIGWTDVAFPWNWSERRHKQGLELIKRADDEFAAKRYRQALFTLAAGVRLAPEDLKARTKLAAVQIQLQREDLAAQTLAEGLPYAGKDAEYVARMFDVHLRTEQYERVLELAEQWEAIPDRTPLADRTVRASTARAQGFLGNTDEAIRQIKDDGLANGPVGQAMIAQILWVNGRTEQAMTLLKRAVVRFPSNDELIQLLVSYSKRSGDSTIAELALTSRALSAPDVPGRLLELVGWYAERKDARQLQEQITSYFNRFGNSEDALLLLARRLCSLGRLDVVDRIASSACVTDRTRPFIALCRIDALLASRRIEEATAAIGFWEENWLAGNPQNQTDIEVLKTLCKMASGAPGDGESDFTKVLNSTQFSPARLVALARRFDDVGLGDNGVRLARKAFERAPTDPQIARSVALFCAEAGDWDTVSEAINRLLDRRRVDLATLRALSESLRSDRCSFVKGRHELLARLSARTETKS